MLAVSIRLPRGPDLPHKRLRGRDQHSTSDPHKMPFSTQHANSSQVPLLPPQPSALSASAKSALLARERAMIANLQTAFGFEPPSPSSSRSSKRRDSSRSNSASKSGSSTTQEISVPQRPLNNFAPPSTSSGSALPQSSNVNAALSLVSSTRTRDASKPSTPDE